jgi:hypothetical protein
MLDPSISPRTRLKPLIWFDRATGRWLCAWRKDSFLIWWGHSPEDAYMEREAWIRFMSSWCN